MAKKKTTITVDEAKLEEARRCVGAASASAAIDLALTYLIRAERIRADVRAYSRQPQGADELALAAPAETAADLADDTDWAALYGVDAA